MTETGLKFRILVIVICLIFVICYLEFLVTPVLQNLRVQLFLHCKHSLLYLITCRI